MTKIAAAVSLETIACGGCGISFGAPENWFEARRKDHKTFFCPNGCQRAYLGETPEERRIRELSAQLECAKVAAQQAADNEMVQYEARKAVERKLSATRAAVTRTKNRVAHGVCPCCNRTFKQLAAHMKNKHPAYAAELES